MIYDIVKVLNSHLSVYKVLNSHLGVYDDKRAMCVTTVSFNYVSMGLWCLIPLGCMEIGSAV